MHFASDNTAPVAPAILDALAEASCGYARGYGNDDWTEAAERRLCEVFERDVAAFLVPTGTAANALAVLSLGATKGGELAAEAVIFFDPAAAAAFGERRKRGGHLLSKHRFIAAQFLAYLAGDRWLELARHANAMADKLSLSAIGLRPVWPVQANLVFVVVPRALDAKLRASGASYYVRNSENLDTGADNVLIRLVTSFATTDEDEDIERFVNLCTRFEARPFDVRPN
jgi:threonine aldolase